MTIHLPFKKRCGFSFEQTYVPFTQGCFVPSLTEIGPVVLGKILKFRQMYLSYFKNYLCVEKGVALLLNEMNPLHPKMLCVKLGWNWPWGSWEDEMWSLQTDGQPENLTWAFSSGEVIKTEQPRWPINFFFYISTMQIKIYSHLACLSHKACSLISQRRIVPLLLLYTNKLHSWGWNSAAVITSVNSSILAGFMSTISYPIKERKCIFWHQSMIYH